MRGIYVAIQVEAHAALMNLATKEGVGTRDMAARLLLEGLRASGALHEHSSGPCGCFRGGTGTGKEPHDGTV